MTDEELDEARALEAHKIARVVMWQHYMRVVKVAARLAREGWMPEDPLLKEAREIVASLNEGFTSYILNLREGRHDDSDDIAVALAALKRGIAIAKERAPASHTPPVIENAFWLCCGSHDAGFNHKCRESDIHPEHKRWGTATEHKERTQ